MDVVCGILLMILVASPKLIWSQEVPIVEVFEEGDSIQSPDEEANGRTFGPFGNFDALGYKENLLHNKISFLFSLIPRPNKWNYQQQPFPGYGPYPFPPGFPAVPPGYPPPGGFRPPYAGGIFPGSGSFYPGFNNPFYPPGMIPGILPVVAENNTSAAGAGGKPPPSAVVAATTTASPAPSAGGSSASNSDSSSPSAEEEEVKRHKTIKMMPKSFKIN